MPGFMTVYVGIDEIWDMTCKQIVKYRSVVEKKCNITPEHSKKKLYTRYISVPGCCPL